jgi:class 3 adenylate cyclase
MEQQIRFCTTSDDVRIAYAVTGEGPPLVVVSGWVSHLELFWEHPPYREAAEALAEHVSYVRYDKRGTGLSDRHVTDYSVEARVRDLEAVVDDLKLKTVALYGMSEGGPVAIAYTAKHPKRVSHLVLQGTFGRSHFKQETVQALIALVRAEWGLASETLSNIFMPGASREEIDFFLRLAREGAHRKDAAAMLEANVTTDVSELLPRIKVPTLVIHARADRAVPFEAGRELAAMIPGARLVPIESDRHSLNSETSQFATNTILDFLLEGQREKVPAAAAATQAAPLTILFTDITSSTALTQSLGDAKAQELVRAHNAIVREALGLHGGAEIKHTGDGIMASFASPSGALDCAIAIQRAVAAHTDKHAESRLGVHIGLNAGEPVAEDEDLFGTSVQLARRICDHASDGEIVASDVVRQLVAGKHFLFADRGEVALRGFEDPARLYEVRWREPG